MEHEITRLNIEDGDVLVVKLNTDNMPPSVRAKVAQAVADQFEALKRRINKQFEVVVLHPNVEIELLKTSQLSDAVSNQSGSVENGSN